MGRICCGYFHVTLFIAGKALQAPTIVVAWLLANANRAAQ